MAKSTIDFFPIFVFLISLIELCIGVCTILFILTDRNEDIINCCNMFQIIDFLYHFIAFFYNLLDDKDKVAPKNALYNPNAHNALMIAVYFIFGKIPILYIIDSYLGYLTLMRNSTVVKPVHKALSKMLSSKYLIKATIFVEIFLFVEFLIRLVFDMDIAILFVIALYVVDILMFGYVISFDYRKVWSDIYDFVGKITKSEQILAIGDLIRRITLELYPTNPLKVQFQ